MTSSAELLISARTQGAADLEKLALQFDRLANSARESGDEQADVYSRIATGLSQASARAGDIAGMVAELDALQQAGKLSASEVEQLSTELGKLGRIDQNISQFRALEAQTKAAARAFGQQQQKLTALSAEYNATAAPSQRMTRELERQSAATAAAAQRFERLDSELNTVSADLAAAGVQTSALAKAQQTLNGSYAELAQRMAGLRQVGDARTLLGVPAHQELRSEIDKIKRAYDTLRTSGALSQRELAQSALKTEERIRELRQQTNGWVESLANARNGIAGIAASGAGIAVVTKAAIDFESAMAEVAKYVSGTDDQLAALAGRFKQLATEIPFSAKELAAMAAQGAQLGVPLEKLDQFVVLAGKVGVAFGLSAAQAGESIGNLSKVFGIPIDNIELLTDAINVLGNSTGVATNKILELMNRVGGISKGFGLTAEQAAAFGASLISLGKSPEVASTAINALLQNLQQAGRQGPEFQAALARIGTSSEQLAADIRDNPQRALISFLSTLEQLDTQSRADVLGQMFGSEYQDDIALLVGSLGQYRNALASISDQTKVTGSVSKEFEARARTTANQITLMNNAVNDAAINLGSVFLPMVVRAAEGIGSIAQSIAGLAEEYPNLAGMAMGLGTVVASVSTLKLAWLAARVAGVGSLTDMAVQAKALALPMGDATAAVGKLGAAFAVLSAGVIGYNIGGYLSENFTIARQAGVALVETFEQLTSLGQLAADAIAAPFTDDTMSAALDRHKQRLADIRDITNQMYLDAERGTPAQIAAMESATAAADAQAEAQRDVAAAASQAGAAVEQAGTTAAEGQQKAVDKVEELILKLDAIPEAMRKSGEAGRAQIQATLGDALQQLSDVDLTRLAERSRAAFGAMSQVTREVAGEALRRLGLDGDRALDGISQETAQAISALDALGAAGVRSGTAISQALDAALSKADGAMSIDQLRERINAFGRQGVLSADQVRDRLTELEIKAAELAAGTDAVAAAFARMGVKSKAELAALAAQAAADFDKINQSGQAAPEGLLAAAQRYLEATQAAGDEAGTALAQAQVRAAEVRLELLGLKPVADAAGDAGESAGNRTAAAMDAAAGSAADARTELESVGASAAGIAQAMGAFQEGLREDLGQLSLAASEAFAARQGLPASAAAASESMEDLSQAVRDANAELGALQVSTLITGNEFSRWFGTAEANAAAVRAQFLEQRLEAERLAESYAQMDISLGTQIPTLDALRERFGLLDDSQLEGLNRSLDAANQKLARLTQAAQDARNELDSINADLQDELDRAAGNQEAILKRQYEQDRARIDALAEQAGADVQARLAAEQALNRLQQKYQQDLTAARKEAQPATSGGGSAGGASGSSDDSARVSKTERLIVELPGGVSRSLDVAPGQLGVATDLLRTLAAAKSVSLGA